MGKRKMAKAENRARRRTRAGARGFTKRPGHTQAQVWLMVVDCPLLFSATAADLRLSRERQPASANQPVPVRQPTAARSFFTATNPEPCGIPRSLSAQLRRRGGVAG